MEFRRKDLSELHSYIEETEKELTMILQSLQWDRKHILEAIPMVPCSYVTGHHVPVDRRQAHEERCLLRSQGYTDDDMLLPNPLDSNSHTVVKLSQHDIQQIINNASAMDPSFKTGPVGRTRASLPVCGEPCTVSRLQATYTGDERRALHDAVVQAAPACHDLADLALLGSGAERGERTAAVKSRAEILAELRDMRRRRTKYRVGGRVTSYCDVLRDVIKTQMEVYSDMQAAAQVDKLEETSQHRADNKRHRSNPAPTSNRERSRERHKDKSNDRGRTDHEHRDKIYRRGDRDRRIKREKESDNEHGETSRKRQTEYERYPHTKSSRNTRDDVRSERDRRPRTDVRSDRYVRDDRSRRNDGSRSARSQSRHTDRRKDRYYKEKKYETIVKQEPIDDY